MSAEHQDNFHHVRDFPFFELPAGLKIELPAFFGFQITKFMVLQVVAAVIVFLIFRGLSRRLSGGKPARGRCWNFWEMMALFVRDEVVRPTIGDGHHEHGDHDHGGHSAVPHGGHFADQYLPFIWSCFFRW